MPRALLSIRFSRRTAALTLAALFAVPLAAMPKARDVPPRFHIHVEALPLNEALRELHYQTGMEYAVELAALKGLTSNRVVGRYTLRDALTQMLAGKPLEWQVQGSYLRFSPPEPSVRPELPSSTVP